MALNFGFLSKPLTLGQMALGCGAIMTILGVYCLAYNSLQGEVVTIADAFSWPVINIIPFFLAWELAKTRSWATRVAALAAGCITSLFLDNLYSTDVMMAFEIVRRVPALAMVTTLFAAGDMLRQRAASKGSPSGELPLLPSQIVRVTSSGNYVLLHTEKGAVIHRAPLQSVESNLEAHGFVRVHRTTLVRRDKIAKVRNCDIVLADGTSVKTGARYRELLQAA